MNGAPPFFILHFLSIISKYYMKLNSASAAETAVLVVSYNERDSTKLKNTFMKKLIIFTIIMAAGFTYVHGQGCVAIRSTGAVCTKQDPSLDAKGWQLNTSYRYFRSFRHFVGKEEQHERIEKHTQVINWQHTLNLNVQRQFSNRWSLAVDLPLITNRRSSLYEHGGNAAGQSGRHNTSASGIGDLRISGYHWLIDPLKSMKVNVQVGLGVKFPTGNYKHQDVFYKETELRQKGLSTSPFNPAMAVPE